MLTAAMIALSFVAVGPTPMTPVRPVAEIIEIRPGMVRPADQLGRDQIRFRANEPTEIVGAVDDGQMIWEASQAERARLGGEDAPELILVRAFDAVFAIDPFVALPEGDRLLARQLIGGTNLEVGTVVYNRQTIDRTEELMRILESARHEWLRQNGFFGVRTYTNPASSGSARRAAPEPAGWFRIPEDMPKTRSREQVRSEPAGDPAGVAAAIFSGDEPVRISLPFGTAPDVVASVERRNRGEVASR
jgi:hypothetical protein